MSTVRRIGLVGDKSDRVRAHAAIPIAISRAAKVVEREVSCEWISTSALEASVDLLAELDALWLVPGSPYVSMQGALAAVRFAREKHIPFLGTCGGFQHAVIEIARDVAGIASADHEESAPGAAEPVIHRLACALSTEERNVSIAAGSRLASIYRTASIREGYHCSFGLNPRYRSQLEDAGLRFTAFDDDGDPRALELEGHPFFVGALFQLELAALRDMTPPVAVAFVRAAANGR